jgi:penicillin amidase
MTAGAAAAAGGAPPAASLQQALLMLRGFNGAMNPNSLGATLAYQTRQEFLHRVLAAKLGDALARQYDWDEAPVFEQWLLANRPAAWLPPEYSATAGKGWDALLLDCLKSVVARTTLQPDQLRWGKLETLSVNHPVWSQIPLLRRYADLGPVEIGGSPLTVKQARNVELGDPNDLGPSMRFVADVGAWDRSTLTLVAGESGRVFTSHYRDEFEAYLRGRQLPLWFTPRAVAAHRAHTLRLVPASN